MIVGHGAIAKAIEDRDGWCFFAAGVANSHETSEAEYAREHELLMAQPRHLHLVYFSSLCVFGPETRYSWHKKRMEGMVRDFVNYTIVRLGNIEWAENPHQLIPWLKGCIASGRPFPVFNEYRHLLSLAEFQYWMKRIPDWNCEMNITGRLMKVSEIVKLCSQKFQL